MAARELTTPDDARMSPAVMEVAFTEAFKAVGRTLALLSDNIPLVYEEVFAISS